MTLPSNAAVLLLKIYRLALSPWLPPACRFHPSCSEYAIDALRQQGFLRGSDLALRRLCRCHPWGGSGFDPVPGPEDARTRGLEDSRIQGLDKTQENECRRTNQALVFYPHPTSPRLRVLHSSNPRVL